MTTLTLKEDEILVSPSPPSPEPGTLLLETERLIIRRYALSDAPALSEAGNDAAVVFNLRNGFPHPYSLSEAESFLKGVIKGCEAYSYPEHNAVFIKPNTPDNPTDEPVFIGSIGVIPHRDIYFRTWELGYWTAQASWGRGLGTEMVRGFTHWLFETWPGLNRVEASAYGRNVQSQNVLRKSGLLEEGRRRGAIDKRGAVMDEVRFGILRGDLNKE